MATKVRFEQHQKHQGGSLHTITTYHFDDYGKMIKCVHEFWNGRGDNYRIETTEGAGLSRWQRSITPQEALEDKAELGARLI